MKFSLFSFLSFAFFNASRQFTVNNFKKICVASLIATTTFQNYLPICHAQELQSHHQITNNIEFHNNNLYLYGNITPDTCASLRSLLTKLESESNIFRENYGIEPPPIKLHIQSNGGTLLHAIYLMDFIHNMKTPVYTYIDGYAASAATIISIAGKKRFMTENSVMLIHQLSSGAEGKYNEMEDSMENMRTLMNIVKNAYSKFSNIPSSKLNDILIHDLWLDSKTCKEYGLVDEII